ncbi:MAG: Ig-like domain-containing protein, partial [Verrucomicrobiota bacterium]
GFGTVGGATTVEGTLSVSDSGSGDRTLDFSGDLTINGALDIDVEGTGSGATDLVAVGGQLIVGGSSILNVTASGLDDPEYVLATYVTDVDPSAFATVNGLSTYTFEVDEANNELQLTAPAATFVRINEVDAQNPSTDSEEFIELYDGGVGNTSLDGLVVVLFNGGATDDVSYNAIDLSGHSTDANGFFVIGSSSVANVDLIEFTTNGLQNGADAVALYEGSAADFPNGTAPTATNLIDAVVYDDDVSDDAALIAILTPGQAQINEDANGDAENHSIARVPNGGTALDTSTYVAQAPTPGESNVDTTSPTVQSIVRTTPATATTNVDSVVFTVTFDENVNDIEVADFQLATTGTAAGTIASVSASSGISVTVTVNSVAGDGDLGLNFITSGDSVTDDAGNVATSGFTGEVYTIDNTAPTVSSINRTTPATATTNADSLVFTVTFDENVSDIEVADFQLATTGTASGTISSVSAATGNSVTVTVNSVAGDGDVGLNFITSGDSVTDDASNTATAGFTGQAYTIDNTAPTVQSINRTTPAAATTNADSLVFTVTFDESVSDIETADFQLATTGTAGGTIASVSAATGNSVTVTVNTVTGDGALGLNFITSGDSVSDEAGNVATAGFTGQIYTIDNTAPTVQSINRTTPPSATTNATSVIFTVTFDENVNDIEVADFQLATTGTAGGSIASLSAATGNSVTVIVNSITGDGNLGLNFITSGDSVTDDAGNAATAGFTGQVYNITNTPSNITIFPVSPVLAEDSTISGTVTATDSDGLAANPYAASNGANGTVTIDGNSGNWSYAPDPDFDGTDTFTVTVTDAANATTTQDVTVIVTPVDDPVSISGDTGGTSPNGSLISGDLDASDPADGLTSGAVYFVTEGADNGSASINAATGQWSYTPAEGFSGADTFTVTIVDDDGFTAQQVISLTVEASDEDRSPEDPLNSTFDLFSSQTFQEVFNSLNLDVFNLNSDNENGEGTLFVLFSEERDGALNPLDFGVLQSAGQVPNFTSLTVLAFDELTNGVERLNQLLGESSLFDSVVFLNLDLLELDQTELELLLGSGS